MTPEGADRKRDERDHLRKDGFGRDGDRKGSGSSGTGSGERANRPALARIAQAADLYTAGRYDLAEQSARAALRQEPEGAQAHALLAMSLAASDHGREALDEADIAIGLDPDSALAHKARAEAFLALRYSWYAEQEAREALRLDPSDIDLTIDLATIVFGSTRFDDALVLTAQALSRRPQYSRALNIHALALAFTGRPDEALAVLATALAAAPEKAGLHSALGLAFERCGDLEHAAVAYREALRLRPDNDAAADGLRSSTAWYRWLIPGHVIGRLRHFRPRRRS